MIKFEHAQTSVPKLVYHNLLVLPFTSLNKNDIDQLMRICLDGPKFLREKQLETIIDIYKDSAPCRISL